MSSGAKSDNQEPGRELPAPMGRRSVNQSIAITNASVASAAFNAKTTLIRLFCDQDCFIQFNDINAEGGLVDPPVATSSTIFCPANIFQFYGVAPGEKLAVIRETTNGTLRIMEVGN